MGAGLCGDLPGVAVAVGVSLVVGQELANRSAATGKQKAIIVFPQKKIKTCLPFFWVGPSVEADDLVVVAADVVVSLLLEIYYIR